MHRPVRGCYVSSEDEDDNGSDSGDRLPQPRGYSALFIDISEKFIPVTIKDLTHGLNMLQRKVLEGVKFSNREIERVSSFLHFHLLNVDHRTAVNLIDYLMTNSFCYTFRTLIWNQVTGYHTLKV